jgi:hypothetical protein
LRVWLQLVAAGALLFGGGLALAGGGALLGAFIQLIDSSSAAEQAEEVRLADLLARWPRGNRHVVLTHFVCGNPLYIRGSGNSTVDFGLWIPVYTPEETGPGGRTVPRKIRAMVFCGQENEEDQVLEQCRRGRVQGMATRGVAVGSVGQKLVLKQNPDTDFSTCLKVEAGRRPLSRTALYRLAGAGAVALLVGALIGLIGFALLLPGVAPTVLAVVLSPFQGDRRSRGQAGPGLPPPP